VTDLSEEGQIKQLEKIGFRWSLVA
jgi:hypothetical protein